MGSVRGRKPLVVETMKAGRVVSSGWVSERTLKVGTGAEMEPILNLNYIVMFCLKRGGGLHKIPGESGKSVDEDADEKRRERKQQTDFFLLLS